MEICPTCWGSIVTEWILDWIHSNSESIGARLVLLRFESRCQGSNSEPPAARKRNFETFNRSRRGPADNSGSNGFRDCFSPWRFVRLAHTSDSKLSWFVIKLLHETRDFTARGEDSVPPLKAFPFEELWELFVPESDHRLVVLGPDMNGLMYS